MEGVKFNVDANNDIHISLSKFNPHKSPSYEIVLGGWSGTQSVIRSYHAQNPALATRKHSRAQLEKVRI